MMIIIKFVLAKIPETNNKHFAIKTTTLRVDDVVFNTNLNKKIFMQIYQIVLISKRNVSSKDQAPPPRLPDTFY